MWFLGQAEGIDIGTLLQAASGSWDSEEDQHSRSENEEDQHSSCESDEDQHSSCVSDEDQNFSSE